LIKYSICGVFPVPPTDKFPTAIIGFSNLVDLKTPTLKK
jgi:hypothetical protein